ncbi:PAS domain-containing protein, partial [bacterium]|nr:PAS domain-containing protein [bacterium]
MKFSYMYIPRIPLLLFLFLRLWFPSPSLADLPPTQRIDQTWRVQSFLNDLPLTSGNVMDVLIQEDGNVWVATTEGLFHYGGYVWLHFTQRDGLPSDFVRCVSHGRDGKVWIGTDTGICFYRDGRIDTPTPKPQLAGPSVHRIVENSRGELWFCCDRWPDHTVTAGLTRFKNGRWTSFTQADGLPGNDVLDYLEDSQGREFVLTNKGIAMRQDRAWQPVTKVNRHLLGEVPWDIVESIKYGIVVTTGRHLFFLKNRQWKKVKFSCPETLPISGRLCVSRDNELFTCLNVDGNHHAFFRWQDKQFVQVSASFPSPKGPIRTILLGPEGSIVACGNGLLLRWKRRENDWIEFTDLSPPVFMDNRERVWFVGEQTNARMHNNQWEPIEYPIQSAACDSNGNVWGWDGGHLYFWTENEISTHLTEQTGLARIDRLVQGPQGSPSFIGKNRDDKWVLAQSSDSAWPHKPCPRHFDATQYHAQIDAVGRVWLVYHDRHAGRIRCVREAENGWKEIRLPEPVTQFQRARLLLNALGRNWFYGLFGLFHSPEQAGYPWSAPNALKQQSINSCLRRNQELWVSFSRIPKKENGLARLKQGTWDMVNTQPCNFGTKTWDDTLYFAARGLLYEFTPRTELMPTRIGIPVNHLTTHLVKDRENRLWLKIGDSVFRYRKDRLPCETFLHAANHIIHGKSLHVAFSAIEAFSPSQTPESFQFAWKLNDEPWSAFANQSHLTIESETLSAGEHVLHVRARDAEGYIDPTSAVHTFTIHAAPLQEHPWFLAGLGGVLGVILVLLLVVCYLIFQMARYSSTLEKQVYQRSEALRDSEQKLQTILNNSTALIYVKDTQGRYVMANKSFERFVNRPFHEFQGKTDRDLFPAPAAEAFREHDNKVLRTKLPMQFEETIQRVEQQFTFISIKVPLFDDREEPYAISGLSTDITARKEAEEGLKRAEEMFRILVENTLVGIYIVQEQRILYANPRFADIFAYEQD